MTGRPARSFARQRRRRIRARTRPVDGLLGLCGGSLSIADDVPAAGKTDMRPRLPGGDT